MRSIRKSYTYTHAGAYALRFIIVQNMRALINTRAHPYIFEALRAHAEILCGGRKDEQRRVVTKVLAPRTGSSERRRRLLDSNA